MPDQISEMIRTLQRLERLLVRFEIDTAAQLHVVDYQATIKLLCDSFQEQMTGLMREPAPPAAQATVIGEK